MNFGMGCITREMSVRPPTLLSPIRAYSSPAGTLDWSTYAIVATIELARANGKNPQVPEWLAESYSATIQELSKIGASEIFNAVDQEEVRAILGVLAISVGARTHARFLIEYSEDELLELES
jgi:hypothetical protein